jgi:hypothetical protein
MITKEKVMVEQEVTTWTCDFCDTKTTRNSGCCGVQQIMRCNFCGKDACKDHRKLYWEKEWHDYPDLCACQDCIPKVDMCEHVAEQMAGRYDNWREVVKRIYDNFDDYKHWLDDYEGPVERQPLFPEDLWELYE